MHGTKVLTHKVCQKHPPFRSKSWSVRELWLQTLKNNRTNTPTSKNIEPSHLVRLSSGKEQDDEQALDDGGDGEDDGPHQENEDEAILGRPWHPGGSWSLEKAIIEKYAESAKCTSLRFPLLCVHWAKLVCVSVCVLPEHSKIYMMRTFWCLTVICCSLSEAEKNYDGNFPCISVQEHAADTGLRIGAGSLHLLLTREKKKKKSHMAVAGRELELWHYKDFFFFGSQRISF